MRINSKDTFAGLPILTIRKLLRHLAAYKFTIDSVVYRLKTSIKIAKRVISELEQQGYIVRSDDKFFKDTWEMTLTGNSFAKATAAKPIKISTADNLLANFLGQVEQVNNNSYYLYKVKKVVLFGSYLSNKTCLGDIDIAIDLESKIENCNEFMNAILDRADEANANGRIFNTYIDRLAWAENEVKLFLKGRSRSISLNDIHDPILKQCKTKVIYKIPIKGTVKGSGHHG